MEDNEINDKRNLSEFKGVSFSKFKRSDVRKELLNSLINSKIEQACYWSAELICAGHYSFLWEIILYFFSKYIHLSNINIAIYLDLRINDFKTILNNGYTDNLLSLRNNVKIRRLFSEVMCVLIDSKRRHSFDIIKIKTDDLNMIHIKDKFKAPSTDYGNEIFCNEDPKELFPFINELAYSLNIENKNQINACYWVEWIIEFENRCKLIKEKLVCERRIFSQVDSKFQKDIIWIIWDLFLREADKRPKIIKKLMNILLMLFSNQYKSGCHKKRKNFLYLAISLLCEHFILEKEIIRHSQLELVNLIKSKIDLIYKQIKINEESTNTDYLFNGLNSNNLEKTIAKLEVMNTFGKSFVPRI
jgi:hypothetical protein